MKLISVFLFFSISYSFLFAFFYAFDKEVKAYFLHPVTLIGLFLIMIVVIIKAYKPTF